MHRPRFIIGCALLLLGGCEQSFEPKAAYEPALAVYAIMRTSSDTLIVRLHGTYDPPAFDPLQQRSEPDLAAAIVSVASASTTTVLRDTLVPHPDPDRYGGTLRVFTARPWTPERGTPYVLTVQAPGYPPVTASTTVPTRPSQFYLSNNDILNAPRFYPTQDIRLAFKPPREARGYISRLFVEFVLLSDTSTVRTLEVPVSVSPFGGSLVPTYPTLQALSESGINPTNTLTFWSFRNEAYSFVLQGLAKEHGILNLRFRRAIVTLQLIDEPLYTYYNIVNGFQDAFSIRTDLPDYTNVENGVGLFGSSSTDSIVVPLNAFVDF